MAGSARALVRRREGRDAVKRVLAEARAAALRANDFMSARRLAALACGATASLTPLGCAESPGDRPASVALLVTRDFGRKIVARHDHVPLGHRRTALHLLARFHDVDVDRRTGGVSTIDGLRHEYRPPGKAFIDEWIDQGAALRRPLSAPRETLWVLMVNGIEADESPDRIRLRPGDTVQWDLRDWFITLSTRATIGAFPQPLRSWPTGGPSRLNVRCANPSQRSSGCAIVMTRLRQAGITPTAAPASETTGPPASELRRARLFVGEWAELRGRNSYRWLMRGPRHSGVFASPSRDGRRLSLLDSDGGRVREVGAGAGLIAAVRPTETTLDWYVTGTDAAGVRRAARALKPALLRGAFAVVVDNHGATRVPLPSPPP